MTSQEQALRDHPNFQDIPGKIQEWILASPHATDAFDSFFSKGGVIESRPEVKLPLYSPEPVPTIRINDAQWKALRQKDAPEYPQRHLFGTLAHEIGHDRYNTSNVLFTGRTEEAYVQYRAGLEAQAIFDAFPIFKDLERHPDFKREFPFNSIGYLSGVELGQMYRQWRNGELDDRAVVEHIAAKVPDRPNMLGGPLPDQNGDGVLTHGDLYLRDFREYVLPRLQNPASSGALDTPGDARAPGSPHSSMEPGSTTSVQEAREPQRTAQALPPDFAPALVLPADLRDDRHPGHDEFTGVLHKVHSMEAGRGIPPGPHSEQVAAALLVAAERNGQRVTHVEMRADGRVYAVERDNAFEPAREVAIDPRQAQPVAMEALAAQWAQARSPHLAYEAPTAARTREQAQALAHLPPADQALFARIREGTPASISDDHVADALLRAKQAGITNPDNLQGPMMRGDRLCMTCSAPVTGWVVVNVSEPAPITHETVQQTLALNREREQQLAMEAMQKSQSAPSRSGLTA
jgi:hypothetical protein